MVFVFGDVTDIQYPDNTFDLAVDKSTIDALL
jgi:ubiquinone/menaquinone biosynthesis C-methylase UbiE